MPRLSEKKPWPMASMNTFPVIFEKSGWKRKDNPALAPGRVKERMARTTRITNSIGISILEYFSMPFCTPLKTTIPVRKMKAACKSTLSQPVLWKVLKSCSMSAKFSPLNELVAALKIYSSVHPATTE